jgi:hypothetical protein
MVDIPRLVRTAKDIQKPISLAALGLIVLLIIFYEIVGKIRDVDQTILPSIVNWLGLITLITVILAIGSYSVPFFLRGKSGVLTVGSPKVTRRQPAGAPSGDRVRRGGASVFPAAAPGETPDKRPQEHPPAD